MPQIENEFLSTFIHELLNSLNGISSIAKILQDTNELDAEEVEESADDLAILTSNANKLIGKVRAVINTKRVLNSEHKQIQALCQHHFPGKNQLPSSLSLAFEDNIKGDFALPALLFDVFFDSLLYTLLHSSDDAFLSEQNIRISVPQDKKLNLSLKLSNPVCISHLSKLDKINPNLVKDSRYGFELKLLSYMCEIYGIEFVCTESTKDNVVNVVFNNF